MLGDVRRAGLLRYHPGERIARRRGSVPDQGSGAGIGKHSRIRCRNGGSRLSGCDHGWLRSVGGWCGSVVLVREQRKIGIILTSYPKKALDFYIGQKTVLRLP